MKKLKIDPRFEEIYDEIHGDENGTDQDKPEDSKYEYKPLFFYAITEEYQIKHEEPSLTIKGFNILSPGEFGCICGLPGSGKTAVIEMFVVAYLVSLHKLKDIDTNDISIKTREGCIVLLDLERPPDDNKGSWNRIKEKTNAKDNKLIEYNENIDGSWIKGFYHFTLAEVQSLDDLKLHLREAYETAKNGFVIIDGVLDFVTSMNSEEDTKAMVILIRSLSVLNDVTTITTLHPNKGSENMAGHLGSNIYRWGRACLIVRPCQDDKSVRELTTNFGMGKLAHADMNTFPGIHFRWSDNSKTFVSADKPDVDASYDIDAIKQVFSGWKTTNSDSKIPSKDFKERYGKIINKDISTVRVHIAKALNSGCFESEGKAQNTVYFKDINDEELPF